MEPNWCQNASNCIKPASDELLLAVLYQIWYSEQPYHALLDQEKWKSVWNREVFVNLLVLLGAECTKHHSKRRVCYQMSSQELRLTPFTNASSFWSQNSCLRWLLISFLVGVNLNTFRVCFRVWSNFQLQKHRSDGKHPNCWWMKSEEEFWMFLDQSAWDFMLALRSAPNRTSSQ